MANLSGVPGDRSSSLGWKLAGIPIPGGAVPPLALALTLLEMGLGKTLPIDPVRLVQLTCRQRFRGPQRQVFVTGVVRLSRLCVLMNPCPAGPEFHSALAGYRDLPKLLEKRRKCFKLNLLWAGHLRGDTRGTLLNPAPGQPANPATMICCRGPCLP